MLKIMRGTQDDNVLSAPSADACVGSMTTLLNAFGATSKVASSSPICMHGHRASRVRSTAGIK